MDEKKIQNLIWGALIVILAIGLLGLYSATYQNPRIPQQIFYGQLTLAILGLGALVLLSRFNYRRYYDLAYALYGLNIFLLVLIIFIGRHALGAKRWIEFQGINFQPSELMKFAMILLLARYFADQYQRQSFYSRRPSHKIMQQLFIPFFLTAIPALLIFKQPDLGSALLVLGIFLVMVFGSGIEMRYLVGFLGAGLSALPILWQVMKPYQKDRILVFMNPNIDPLGAGYTIIQSKIAVGSGGILGKGWLSGSQNQLNFLPERHTDFIFSVIGEEWGLLGGLVLISCFFVILMCAIEIIDKTADRFGYLLGLGIIGILTLQVFINVGMVIGICPIVGITLPFVSYGRSSFIVFLLMIGVLLNLNRQRTIF